MKMEQTDCSETSAREIQKPGNNPKQKIQHSEKGEKFLKQVLLICTFVSFS
jgi:hypothetical protein